MRRMWLVLMAAGLSAATLSESGVEQWVRDRGGDVTRDRAGRINGVKLNLAWISDADAGAVAVLPNLRTLDLSFSLVTDAGIERLKPLEGVTDLNLYSVERITDVSIAYIRGWRHLERLNLRGTDITDTSLQYLAGFPALKSLDVSHTQVTNNGMEFLAGLQSLEEFRVGGNKVTSTGLRWLKVLPNLRVLDLHGVQKRNSGLWSVSLTDLDMDTLAGFEQLRELNIAGGKITDAGAQALARISGLRVLDLSGSQVSGKGLEALAGLRDLRRLSLWRARNIRDDAGGALASMQKLDVLDLTDTRVTDAALAALAKSSSGLRHLYLSGTGVTAQGVEAFERAHPQCEVSWK
jgi:Leucine-rich repeat (LRR) protein